jgi:hypothetical protein
VLGFVAVARGRFWHDSDVAACPLNVRSCGKTGSDILVLSLTADDPKPTSINSCPATTIYQYTSKFTWQKNRPHLFLRCTSRLRS